MSFLNNNTSKFFKICLLIGLFLSLPPLFANFIFPPLKIYDSEIVFYCSRGIVTALGLSSILFFGILISLLIVLSSSTNRRKILVNKISYLRIFLGETIALIVFLGLGFSSIYLATKKITLSSTSLVYYTLFDQKEVAWSEIKAVVNYNPVPSTRLGPSYSFIDLETKSGQILHLDLRFISQSQELIKQILEQIKSPVISPKPTPNPITDWKSYTNQEYNFSFSYPQSWQQYQDETSPSLVNIDTDINSGYVEGPTEPGESITFKLFVGVEDRNLYDDWKKETSSKAVSNISELRIGNFPAYQTVNFPGGMLESLDTFIEIGDNIHLQITLWPYFKTALTSDQDIIRSQYDQILSTFNLSATSTTKVDTRQKRYLIQETGGRVYQGSSQGFYFKIEQQALKAEFEVTWDKHDHLYTLEVTLIDPSGMKISPQSLPQNVRHIKGLTFETYWIEEPIAGVWKVNVYGEDIPENGVEYDLRFFETY